MMRDQLCFCGCDSNAASSSRSTAVPAVSSRKRDHIYAPTNQVSTRPAHSESASDQFRQMHGASRSVAPQSVAAKATASRAWTRRSRRSHIGLLTSSILPLVLMLLCAICGTVAASAVPAITAAPGYNISDAISNTASPARPTSSPTSAAETSQHEQRAVVAAASSAGAAPNHNVDVQVTQPTMCQYMNITFDPSRGSPPYTLMISIEDYWPEIISLPATYDDASKDLWLYQYNVPTFTGPTTNPNMIVSVSDSTGLMSNSSNFVQVLDPNVGATCPPFQYSSPFYFYTEHAASMCQDYDVFWNGTFTPPIAALFLPESAPPIYVPTPANDLNLTWQVSMEGGTRFVSTISDSRGTNGGVSKFNIVALNEYVSDSCIAQAENQHRLFAPTITASPATIFPDATSTIATLTTSGGRIATVTVVETIKNGRFVHGNGGGGLSLRFIILMSVIFVSMGLIGVAVGYFCFRRHQKRNHNIKAWDLPNNDPSVPFSADPNMPITPGVFGRSDARQHANAAAAAGRNSISGRSNYDPASLSTQPLTNAPSARASLRSWTSSAFEHLHLGTGGANQRSLGSAGDYALMSTASVATGGVSPSEAQVFSFGNNGRSAVSGRHSNSSRDAWSPTDSIPRAFGFYSDDPQSPDHVGVPELRSQHRTGSPPVASRGGSSDEVSAKSLGVGPGPTYRPDAASQAAYQDLLASTPSPANGVERSIPSNPARGQAPDSSNLANSRTPGWAEVSDESRHGTYNGADNSTRIVRHADAGLLLDDNDNGDELINLGTGRLMELPPQYDTIHPSSNGSHQRPPYAQAPPENPFESQPPTQRSQRSHAQNMASVDISDARNRLAEVHASDLVDENDDESAFWAH